MFALREYRLKWKWREMEVQTWYAFAIVLEGSLVRLGWENIIVWTSIDRSIEMHGVLVLQSIDQFIWFILMVFACVQCVPDNLLYSETGSKGRPVVRVGDMDG